MGLLKWLLGWLLPPLPGASPEIVHQFHWRVVIVTAGNSIVTGAFLAVSFGAVPFISGGFAARDDLDKAKATITQSLDFQSGQWREVRRAQVDSKIFDIRVRQCSAIKARDRGQEGADLVVQFATERLQEQLQAYWDLTRMRYRVPDCSEV